MLWAQMKRELTIGKHLINDESTCYVIAEIGQNHMGSVETCKQLIDAAHHAGCAAVKLQKRNNKDLYTEAQYNQPYISDHSFGDTYGTHREALEFNWDQYVELKAHCDSLGIDFFATAWDFDSTDFLAKLGVPAVKMASGDLQSIPLLKYVAQMQVPMIISTGGASIEDVDRALEAIVPINPQVAILQCTAAYPVEPENMHLSVISSFRQRYPSHVVGLSDHQNGISMSILAYALGARIFEKHFTLNRAWKGGDQAFSLEPEGMRKMVRDLNRARLAIGDSTKRPYDSETKPLTKMRKKIVAKHNLPAGHVVQESDLAYKSPGDGMAPWRNTEVIGRKLKRAMSLDDAFAPEDLE